MNLAPFNEWAGHEIGHDATARLIYEEDGETMEAFAKSRLLSEVKMEAVEVVRFARFITETVAKRRLPTSAGVKKPNVVIKVTTYKMHILRHDLFDLFRLILRGRS